MWPLTRRGALIRRPLQERWRAGDIAECVRDDWLTPCRQPLAGAHLMVIAVRPGHVRWRKLGWALQLVGYPGLWDATAFRKITPTAARARRNAGKRLLADT